MKKLSILCLGFLMVLSVSCNKDELNLEKAASTDTNISNEETENYTLDQTNYCEGLSSNILVMGAVMAEFADAIIMEGEDLFNERTIGFNNYLASNYTSNEPIPLEEFAELFSEFYNIELTVSTQYFVMIGENKSFLENLSVDEHFALQSSILCYIQENNGSAQSRWVLTTLANMFDLGCHWEVAAGIADAAFLAAGTMVIATTGVGLAWGAVATASAFTNAMITANDCNP